MSRLNQFEIYDELPLWSAPFGLILLDTIRVKKGINILDIGSGGGFPLLEIAERYGSSVAVYGIDPSADSIEMITKKIKIKGIFNAVITKGIAEELPFPDHFFGLIVGNNGINNVQDEKKVLTECARVLTDNGQMVLTMNLPHTFIEFYEIFEKVLQERGLVKEVSKLQDHIYAKRKPIEYWKKIIVETGFTIRSINVDGFKMRFANGTTFLEHYFVRTAFRKPWEEIIGNPEIFKIIEDKLNGIASSDGELEISVPYACFDSYKTVYAGQ
jgi:ubiquinone/menaquinone biosynthesis C-methylase UbiE